MSALAVIAKAPLPGRVKTRLCPPCTSAEAAALAEAALRDVLDAVRATPAQRRVVVLEGQPGDWLGDGLEIIPQRGGGLDERLASAFDDLGEPALIVGMDTPQVTSQQLLAGLRSLESHDAAFGPTRDGGYWAIGLRRPDRRALDGVAMSREDTGELQLARLAELGLDVARLDLLEDVDDITTARMVAGAAPLTRFGQAFHAWSAGVET